MPFIINTNVELLLPISPGITYTHNNHFLYSHLVSFEKMKKILPLFSLKVGCAPVQHFLLSIKSISPSLMTCQPEFVTDDTYIPLKHPTSSYVHVYMLAPLRIIIVNRRRRNALSYLTCYGKSFVIYTTPRARYSW